MAAFDDEIRRDRFSWSEDDAVIITRAENIIEIENDASEMQGDGSEPSDAPIVEVFDTVDDPAGATVDVKILNLADLLGNQDTRNRWGVLMPQELQAGDAALTEPQSGDAS